MGTVGIRELKQNASAIVAQAAQGETVTITDRGVPVARLTGIRKTWLEELIEQGEVQVPEPGMELWNLELPAPLDDNGPSIQEILDKLRAERF